MGVEPLNSWNAEAASALQWWRDAGVDMLVADDPRDWMAPPAPARAATAAQVHGDGPAPAPVAPAGPQSLPDTIEEFARWRVGPDAPEARWHMPMATMQNVPGAPLMVVFDLPEPEGESDILLGGSARRLFDRMLAAVGLDPAQVALSALALARPATGQVPAADMARLAELTRHHIGLIAPERVLLLGDAVNRALFGAESARNRGGLHAINMEKRQFRSVASYHPRFLIQRPIAKAESWKHLQLLFWGD